MWDSVWHLRGEISLDGVLPNQDPIYGVALLLAEQQHLEIGDRVGSSIEFERPFWMSFTRRPYGPFGFYERGRFWVEQGLGGRAFRYDLSSARIFVCYLLIAALMFVMLGASAALLCVVFLSFYAAHVLWARVRISQLLREAVRGD